MTTRKAYMDNYCFVDSESLKVLVDPKDFDRPFCLLGISTIDDFEPDALLTTSSIIKIEDGVAYTYSGSQYTLGNMNEDYKQFLEAKENGIPVVSNWFLEDIYYEDKWILEGEVDGQDVSFEIYEQNGGYITLGDGTQAFVNWRDMSVRHSFPMQFFGEDIAGLNYPEDFEKFAHLTCCPTLFEKE